jgi:hypothetical protein
MKVYFTYQHIWICVILYLYKTGNVCTMNIEACSCNHCCSGKAVSITWSECVFVALSIHHAMCVCVCHIVICGQYFSTLSHKLHNFFIKIIKQNMCFDFLCNFHLKHFSFWKELNEIWSKMYIGFCVKCPLYLYNFNETWLTWTDVLKILRHQISWKSIQWKPSCSMWTDQQTDRNDEANSCFSQFSKHT